MWHNGNVHRAAANIIVTKSRAARGSVCNVLLSRGCQFAINVVNDVVKSAIENFKLILPCLWYAELFGYLNNVPHCVGQISLKKIVVWPNTASRDAELFGRYGKH